MSKIKKDIQIIRLFSFYSGSTRQRLREFLFKPFGSTVSCHVLRFHNLSEFKNRRFTPRICSAVDINSVQAKEHNDKIVVNIKATSQEISEIGLATTAVASVVPLEKFNGPFFRTEFNKLKIC